VDAKRYEYLILVILLKGFKSVIVQSSITASPIHVCSDISVPVMTLPYGIVVLTHLRWMRHPSQKDGKSWTHEGRHPMKFSLTSHVMFRNHVSEHSSDHVDGGARNTSFAGFLTPKEF
jgi:hypothetical protein